jgi:PAS domain S-box-containing protein
VRQGRKLVFFAAASLLLHVISTAVFGTRQPGPLFADLIELVLGLLAAIASALAARRSNRFARQFWRLICIAWFLWAVSQVITIYYDNVTNIPFTNVWSIDFATFVFAVPLALALILNPTAEAERFDWQTVLDFTQIGILAVLIPCLWLNAGAHMEYSIWQVLSIRSAVLVLGFLARASFTRSRLVAFLYLKMGLILLLYGLGDSLYLFGMAFWNLQTGGWFELAYTIPVFLAVVVPATWEQPTESEPSAVTGWVVPVLPILFPLAVLLVTSELGEKNRQIARFATAVSFIAALARLAVTQYREQLLAVKGNETLEELEGQRKFLRLVIDSNPQLIFAKDWDGRFTLANKALGDICGTKSEDMLGKRDSDFHINNREVAGFRVADRRVISTGEQLFIPEEPVTDARTGRVRWFQTLKVPLVSLDRKVNQVLGVATDISARKEAEDAVVDWKNRYEAAVLASGQVIYDWEPSLDRVTLGGSLEQTLGYSVAEASSHAWWATIVHPDDRDRYLGEVERCVAAKQAFHLEYRVRRADDRYITVRDDGYFILDAIGSISRMVGFVGDVTEQRLLEARVRQSHKMEEVGQLAGGVAHDFNNLLGVIIGQTEMLLQRISAVDPAYTRVRQIQDAAMRGAALTRQLLAFGRKQVLQTELVDLNATLTSVGELLWRIIGEDIELVLLPDQSLGITKADPAQLGQIILNLVVNSRDAMPKGGKLTIETRNAELDEAYCEQHVGAKPGRYVMLRVTDTGCGMDTQTQARIFEPFFTTKEVGKGTGLGLSTVYGIVKQSEGYIGVTSQPGKGSEFTVFLPRVEGKPTFHQVVVEVSAPPRGSEIVLLVEDEPDFREMVAESLQELGYRVLTAASGRRAIEVAQECSEPIDLLVTDVVMPNMSGRELVQHIRAHRPAIKVLYMSGYTRGVIAEPSVLESGASFLQKPFLPSDLAHRVREMLDAVASPLVPQKQT